MYRAGKENGGDWSMELITLGTHFYSRLKSVDAHLDLYCSNIDLYNSIRQSIYLDLGLQFIDLDLVHDPHKWMNS